MGQELIISDISCNSSTKKFAVKNKLPEIETLQLDLTNFSLIHSLSDISSIILVQNATRLPSHVSMFDNKQVYLHKIRPIYTNFVNYMERWKDWLPRRHLLMCTHKKKQKKDNAVRIIKPGLRLCRALFDKDHDQSQCDFIHLLKEIIPNVEEERVVESDQKEDLQLGEILEGFDEIETRVFDVDRSISELDHTTLHADVVGIDVVRQKLYALHDLHPQNRSN